MFLHIGRYCERLRKAVFPVCAALATCTIVSSGYALTSQPLPVTYRTAAAVHTLTPELARRGDQVQIQGVVTRFTERGFTLQDDTGGIWVDWNLASDFALGDFVAVQGVVDPGAFSPNVIANNVRKLGHGSLPIPKPLTFKQLSTGDEDSQYVSIVGVVRSVGLRPSASPLQRLWLKIEMSDGIVYASFPAVYAESADKLIDATVRIDAVASSTKNEDRQLISPTLMASDIRSVTILHSPAMDLFDRPLLPIAKLMQYRSGTDYFHRVRVAGTVTYYKPNQSVVLEDGGKSLLVVTEQTAGISLGDRIEVVGFPSPSDSGPILQDAVLRIDSHGEQLRPAPVAIRDLSSGVFNYDLVITAGRLLRHVHEPFREVLLLQDGADLLMVELGDGEDSSALQRLQDGSTVRVSGISVLDIVGTWHSGGPSASTIRYRMLLRSPNDVQVLRQPSWWNMVHVLYVAVFFGVLVLVFFVLVVLGRLKGWRLQAALDERERLAYEIHDSLAQSLAGIGFQLQAIGREIPGEMPELRRQVDLARALVRHSHKEAMRSFEPSIAESSSRIDLLLLLDASARKMVDEGHIEVTTMSEGIPHRLSPEVALCLLRIGQEAIANAVRHADSRRLEILLAYKGQSVRLAIKDDGCGFIVSGDLLGFGLRGMRKRSGEISAQLEILSRPGEGTCIQVTARSIPGSRMHELFTLICKRPWERLYHANK
jgi:signal transduction histidine kinase